MDLQDLLISEGYEDWECDPEGYVLTCPHGENIEPDGKCSEGCESPLLELGWI